MRIKFVFVVDIDAGKYVEWAGIDPGRVRQDVIDYVTCWVSDLPAFCDTMARIEWRYIGDPPPRPGRDRAYVWERLRVGEGHGEERRRCDDGRVLNRREGSQ